MKTVVNDTFWNRYRELVRTQMIPIDIRIEKERNDASIPSEKSHAIENFKIAAGRTKGEHYGWVFQDSDVYKWLEAAAYTLRNHPDEELKKITDEVVYMCTALADVAASTGNKELEAVCTRIWRNIVDRRIFITGGIGSTVNGESFTLDNRR